MNKIFVFTIFVLFSISAKADNLPQSKDALKFDFLLKADSVIKERTCKNVVKLNLMPLFWKTISVQYEYAFHKNMSGALGFYYFVKRPLPQIFAPPADKPDGWKNPYIAGWAITPEFRFYPGAKTENQAPHGFYIAPYFRYVSYSLIADYYDIGVDANNIPYNNQFAMRATYSGFAGGLMIGSQWILNKNFSIDWWIFGGGAGPSKLTIAVETVAGNVNLSTQDQEDLKVDIQNNIGSLGKYGSGSLNIETSPTTAKIQVKGIPMTSLRGFGFTLGYAF